MRAILINAKDRTISEIELPDDDDSPEFNQEIYRAIDCTTMDMVRWGDHDVYVDDEGLMNNLPYGFAVKLSTGHLYGNGLVLGHKGDRSISATLTVEEVRAKIAFWSR